MKATMRIIFIFGMVWLSQLALCADIRVSPGLCTNVSFSYPGWELADWRLLADDGGMEFQLTNNAIPNTTLSCRRYGSPTSMRYSRVCSDRQTTFTYDGQSSVLAIHGYWACDETNLKFEAIGNITLDCPTGPSVPCTLLDARTIRASLLAPVQVSPKPVPAPPGADAVGCTRNSRSPSWEVDGLVSYQPTLDSVTVEFDLTNMATGDRRHCRVMMSLGASSDGSSHDWLPCDDGVSLARPLITNRHETATYVRLDRSSNTLELNQTWYCGDLGDRNQYRFTASAAVSPALHVNGSAPPKLVVPVDPGAVSEQKLPPSTLQRPRAFGRSCTVTMLTAPPPATLEISGFWFGTFQKDAGLVSYVNMSITNGMLGAVIEASAGGSAMTPGVQGVSNPDFWYGCNGGTVAAPAGSLLLNCSFAFDKITNRVSVTESWICADKDHEHP